MLYKLAIVMLYSKINELIDLLISSRELIYDWLSASCLSFMCVCCLHHLYYIQKLSHFFIMTCDEELGPDPLWETQLRPRFLKVAELLLPRRNRLPARLFSASLINGEEEQQFSTSNEPETEVALKILRVLQIQRPQSFDRFCEVLRQVKELLPVEKWIRPNRRSMEAQPPAKKLKLEVEDDPGTHACL